METQGTLLVRSEAAGFNPAQQKCQAAVPSRFPKAMTAQVSACPMVTHRGDVRETDVARRQGPAESMPGCAEIAAGK